MTLSWFNIRSARAYSISDDQQREELRAQGRLEAAIKEMRAALEDVNSSSVLVEVEPSAFDDFVHDQCPSEKDWAEKMSARRP